MKILGDYHTHTVFTHGKGTIEENVACAVQRGLKQIAITEHSFRHMAHGINRKKFFEIKEEIERLKKIYPIDILLGIEADLISDEGDIDVPSDILPMLDIIVLGYHKLFWTSPKQFFTFLVPNTFRIGQASKKRIEKNTNAYIKAIDKYKINILAHLNYANCTVDTEKLSKYCADKNVYIELNGKGIYFDDKDISNILSSDAKFIVDSDAHRSCDVGKSLPAFEKILKYNIPIDRLANVNKLPDFDR